jgi:hypothetical protein
MAKGPKVTEAVKALITTISRKHPKWKAPEVRNEVSIILCKTNPELHGSFPSLSTVQKVLATNRKNLKELAIDPQEKPWSIAALDQSQIPPEALPKLLEVFAYLLLKKEKEWVHLTIREAKWIARLSFIVKDPEILYSAALEYAEAERVAQISGLDMADPYTGLIDDTMLYEDMRQEMKRPLSPEETQTLRHRIREEWDKLKRKKGVYLEEEINKNTADKLIARGLEELRKKEK